MEEMCYVKVIIIHLSLSPYHHKQEGGIGVTFRTCSTIVERAQISLVWIKTSSIENTSYPWKLGVTKRKLKANNSSWHPNSRMLKNTSIEDVSKKF